MASRIGTAQTTTEWANPGSTTTAINGLSVPAGTNRCAAVIVASSNPGSVSADMIPSATLDGNAMEELAGMYPVNNIVAQTKMFGYPIADGDLSVDIVITFAAGTCARVIHVIFIQDVNPADLADAVTDVNNNGANAIAAVTITEDDTVNGYVLGWCNWRNAIALTCANTGEGSEIANSTIDQPNSPNFDTGLAVIESTGDASVAAQWTASGTITMQARGLRFNHLAAAVALDDGAMDAIPRVVQQPSTHRVVLI